MRGTVQGGDCAGRTGSGIADFFEIRLGTAAAVSIVVRLDTGSDPVLAVLYDEDRTTLRWSFLAPGIADTLGGYFPAGTYALMLEAAGSDTGRYTVSSSSILPASERNHSPFMGCIAGESYSIGTTVAGALDGTGCHDTRYVPLDRYTFTLLRARTVTIDLASPSFDPYLWLFNAQGTLIAYDDDSGPGRDARLTIRLAAGEYSIGASAYAADESGGYSLSSR